MSETPPPPAHTDSTHLRGAADGPVGLSPRGLRRLEEASALATRLCGLAFPVRLGPLGERPRAQAELLHAQLPAPEHAVLLACDPDGRVLEIVTGRAARRVLTDLDCRLAAATMRTSFAAGDLVGGLVLGVQQLGQAAVRPATLHTEQP